MRIVRCSQEFMVSPIQKQKLLDEYLVFLEEAKKKGSPQNRKKNSSYFLSHRKLVWVFPCGFPKGSDIRQNLITFSYKRTQEKGI